MNVNGYDRPNLRRARPSWSAQRAGKHLLYRRTAIVFVDAARSAFEVNGSGSAGLGRRSLRVQIRPPHG
jgi:hypothetical protein